MAQNAIKTRQQPLVFFSQAAILRRMIA